MKLRLKASFGMLPVGTKAASSLKGTEKIARGKAEGGDPGIATQTGSDPERVEQNAAADVAPLQGANIVMTEPWVPAVGSTLGFNVCRRWRLRTRFPAGQLFRHDKDA